MGISVVEGVGLWRSAWRKVWSHRGSGWGSQWLLGMWLECFIDGWAWVRLV